MFSDLEVLFTKTPLKIIEHECLPPLLPPAKKISHVQSHYCERANKHRATQILLIATAILTLKLNTHLTHQPCIIMFKFPLHM